MRAKYAGKAVVITGASSGIGRACARWLAGRGAMVFAGVRKMSGSEAFPDHVTPILLDVTLPETIASARRTIEGFAPEAGLAGLVNNAGVYCGGPLEFSDLDEVRRTFEVNLFGAVSMTQAFLPLLRASKGRIVNMSSISGLIALPFFGPYAASKHALEAVSDSWRVELRPWGIPVALIEPGVVDTPLVDKATSRLREMRESLPPEAHELYGPVFGLAEKHLDRGIPVDRVAKAVEHALFARRPKSRYVLGNGAKFLSIFRKLPTSFQDWMISRHLPSYGDGRHDFS